MAEYPQRNHHFAHRVVRLMIRTCAAQEIGTDGFLLVTVIAHTEDAKRYTSPVTFWNDQLVSILGFTTWGKLDRARKRAVEAGWLHYEPGGKSKVGRYWTIIPAIYDTIPDGAVDCDYPTAFLSTSEETTEGHPGDKRDLSGGQTGDIRGTSGEHSTLTLSLSLPPPPLQTSGEADKTEEEEEVRNLVKTLRGDPYGVNEAVTAVEQATASGCTVDELRAIATQWALADKWSSAQLWTRISRAMPGESPVAHWPPPDASKQQTSRRGTGDPETDRANQEYLQRRERTRRANGNQAQTPESLAAS